MFSLLSNTTSYLFTLAASAKDTSDDHGATAGVAPSMFSAIADVLSLICLIVGLLFFAVGAIGMIRLPDYMNRMHAVSKCSTLGLMSLLLATVLHVESIDMATKALLTLLFAFVATPVGTHVLAKAALNAGEPMWDGTLSNEHED